MGYRSEVAFVVEFADEAGRDKVLGMLDAEQVALVLDAVELVGGQVRFHESGIKWYATKDLGTVAGHGFADIDALEAFLDAATGANDTWESLGPDEGVPSVGAFVRVGEEDDDNDVRYWGFMHPADLGLPEPYNLLSLSRSIYIGWKE